jgi:hypothetical protein
MFRSFVNGAGTITTVLVPAGYQAQAGELVTEAEPTDDDLSASFSVAHVKAIIESRCAEVDALRDGKFDAGMAYGGKVLQLRDVDQQRIIAAGATAKFAVMSGGSWPADFAWIMADNSLLPLDAAGMSAMADAASAQVQAWIFKAYQHKTALRALTDAAAVAAYDISAGW